MSYQKNQNRYPYNQQRSKHRDSNRTDQNQPYTKIFVTGLSNKMTRKGLLSYFRRLFPSVLKVIITTNGHKHQKISGFGFLAFTNEQEVKEALQRKRFLYKGRCLRVEPYLESGSLKKHRDDLKQRRIFVGKIPRDMIDRELQTILSELLGPIEHAYGVVNCHDHSHQGFGYATFEDKETALRAIRLGSIYVEQWDQWLALERVNGKRGGRKRSGHTERSDDSESSYLPKRELVRQSGGGSEVRGVRNDYHKNGGVSSDFSQQVNKGGTLGHRNGKSTERDAQERDEREDGGIGFQGGVECPEEELPKIRGSEARLSPQRQQRSRTGLNKPKNPPERRTIQKDSNSPKNNYLRTHPSQNQLSGFQAAERLPGESLSPPIPVLNPKKHIFSQKTQISFRRYASCYKSRISIKSGSSGQKDHTLSLLGHSLHNIHFNSAQKPSRVLKPEKWF